MAKFEYWPRYGPENYSLVVPYELDFDVKGSTEWMERNWIHSITLSFIYIVAIFAGQRVMKFKKPFSLEQSLFWWNIALATFSALGAVRMMPELIWSVGHNSFVYSICTASYVQGISGFWSDKFAMSKVVELVDTAFIVLRKRPLLFLHWYHHVTVLIYTWMLYKDHTASGRWFVSMNYIVHAFMYTYYALRALHYKFPKWTAMLLTLMQIAQMVVGVYIGFFIYMLKLDGFECQHTWSNLYASFLIYFTYFLLFCNFFYKTYLKPGNRYAAATASKGNNSSVALANGHINTSNAAKASSSNVDQNDPVQS